MEVFGILPAEIKESNKAKETNKNRNRQTSFRQPSLPSFIDQIKTINISSIGKKYFVPPVINSDAPSRLF